MKAMPSRTSLVAVLLLCTSAEAGWTHSKRSKSSSGSSSAADMLASLAELLHITTPPFVFRSDEPSSRMQLIDELWKGAWAETVTSRFTDSNPALTLLLDSSSLLTLLKLQPGSERFRANRAGRLSCLLSSEHARRGTCPSRRRQCL
jgi:hypothetical protein